MGSKVNEKDFKVLGRFNPHRPPLRITCQIPGTGKVGVTLARLAGRNVTSILETKNSGFCGAPACLHRWAVTFPTPCQAQVHGQPEGHQSAPSLCPSLLPLHYLFTRTVAQDGLPAVTSMEPRSGAPECQVQPHTHSQSHTGPAYVCPPKARMKPLRTSFQLSPGGSRPEAGSLTRDGDSGVLHVW